MSGVFHQNKLDLMILVARFNFFICLLTLLTFSCKNKGDTHPSYQEIKGYAQGTTFSVIYEDSAKKDFSSSIDSLLNEVDLQMSTYDTNSFISKFNSDSSHSFNLQNQDLFVYCFNKSKYFHLLTDGAFNPAIFPLVKYWGFYSRDSVVIDSIYIKDAILPLVQMDSILIKTSDDINNIIYKTNLKAKLDFNAIAQGYSVDLVADFLKSNRIGNYMVEIGGEVSANGLNSKGKSWRIGIERPVDSSYIGEYGFQRIIKLKNKSLATSGNYRNFKTIDGKKVVHTIDPKTGYPVENNLLSVTVICDKAIEADALATSFMVMGKDKAINFIHNYEHGQIDAYMIYDSLGKYMEWSNF